MPETIHQIPLKMRDRDVQVIFRPAEKKDLPQLITLENRCFNYDQLKSRNFLWMLEKAHADLIVAEVEGIIAAYAIQLYRCGASLARIYSIAVAPESRGLGLGAAILLELEQRAKAQDCVYLRLEVQEKNIAAITLYQRLGYKQFDVKPDYYDDHSTALCFEKRIIYPHPETRLKVPFYRQTTEFSCGPASLLMAMTAINTEIELTQAHELQLWRESTTIFMTSGHGGCGPHGLALAAHRRGFKVNMYLSNKDVLFIDSVRSPEKREVIRLVQQDFMRQLQQTPVAINYRNINMQELIEHLDAGHIPLMLISTYRINRNKAPHWVTLTAHDPHFIYLHDPDVEAEQHASDADNYYVPIPKAEFFSMAKFGRTLLRAALVLSK